MSWNRALGDVSLDLTRRKPSDYLAERPFLKDGRGNWIRTSDLVVPSHALFQAELCPEVLYASGARPALLTRASEGRLHG